jgi:hypothetical protein
MEAYVEARAADASDGNEAREIRESYADMPVPDFMPAFAGVESDALGFLWVEAYRGMGAEAVTYHVFDPRGELVGAVELPEEMDLLEIGPDYLLALFRDELDVEYVRLYSLQRPE